MTQNLTIDVLKITTIFRKINQFLKNYQPVNKNKKTKKALLKNLFLSGFLTLEKIVMIDIFVALTGLLLIVSRIIQAPKIKQTIPRVQIESLMIGFIFFSILLLIGLLGILGLILMKTVRTHKKYKYLNHKEFIENIRYAIQTNILIQELSNDFDREHLEAAERILKITLEEYRSYSITFSKFLPILVIIALFGSVYITGISLPILSQEYNLDYWFPGISFFTMILLGVQYLYESGIQAQIIKYEKCLMILKQAQAMVRDEPAKPNIFG